MTVVRYLMGLCMLCLAAHTKSNAQGSGKNPFEAAYASMIGKPFPAFDVILQDGSQQTSATIKGKVLYANFWYEGCNPCRAEFKAMNALYDSLKGNPDFVFIAFTFEPAARLPKIIKDYGLRFPIASISRAECERLKIIGTGYPTNIITNKQGQIVYYRSGGPGSVEKAQEKFKAQILPVILQQF